MLERKNTNLKCKVVCIAMVDALFNSLNPNYRQHWSKGLLPSNSHVRAHMINKKWPDKITFSLPFLQINKPHKTIMPILFGMRFLDSLFAHNLAHKNPKVMWITPQLKC